MTNQTQQDGPFIAEWKRAVTQRAEALEELGKECALRIVAESLRDAAIDELTKAREENARALEAETARQNDPAIEGTAAYWGGRYVESQSAHADYVNETQAFRDIVATLAATLERAVKAGSFDGAWKQDARTVLDRYRAIGAERA